MAEKVVAIASKSLRIAVQSGRPAFTKFWTYARVEMRPPKIADINPAITQAMNLLNALKSGRWKSVTVKDGILNAVVTAEVLAWFFVGEIIGRRSIIGYSRVPGAYIKSHV
ncbi:ATP synthase subunit g [Paragonimus heterotremus]|uniref:ATP synthase subunit g n=1 Tax=Paragonimus heterotremus TaxID=100268 RepID=A0A8J4TBZ8_9TREM|nr:ATP synthase subunit g [Paragonimus heterotremus]